MAAVTINVPAALIPRLKEAMRSTFPEQAALTDVQAFQEITASYWRSILRSYEANKASTDAMAVADAKAAADAGAIV